MIINYYFLYYVINSLTNTLYGMQKGNKSSKNLKRNLQFTFDKPVTRQMIANESGMSYATIRRYIANMDFVAKRGLICPATYKKILVELGYIPH